MSEYLEQREEILGRITELQNELVTMARAFPTSGEALEDAAFIAKRVELQAARVELSELVETAVEVELPIPDVPPLT